MEKKFWKITNDADTAQISLYGEIAGETWLDDEITPKMFMDELAACGGKPVDVHINSLGGDLFAAQVIYTAIKNYAGRVTVYIDGLCASAATIVASAGDRVIMPVNALYMIHNPSCGLMGYYDAGRLKKMADTLETVKQTIVNVYTARSKRLTEQQVKNLMTQETWMDANEALEKGFIDEIAGRADVDDSGGLLVVNSVSFDISKFKDADHALEILARTAEKEKDMDNKTLLEKIKNIVLGEGAPAPAQPDPVQVERDRVAALDALKNGNPAVDALVETAKQQGATAETLKAYVDAMPAPVADNSAKLEALKALILDNLESGAPAVTPSASAADDDAVKRKAAIDQVVKFANAGK